MTRRIFFFYLMPVLAALFFCDNALSSERAADAGSKVSLINLIATPERYNGKLVFVAGYVSIELENMSICPEKNTPSKKDCVWLNIDSGPYETNKDKRRYESKENSWKKYDGKFVSVRGTFDKDDSGHLNGWSGAIKNVIDIYGNNTYTHFP